MALHRAQDRLLPTLNGNVLKSGGSLDLAKGQFGIFNMRKSTKRGLEAVNDFSNITKKDKLQFRLGKHDAGITRTRSNKNEESRVFSIEDIEDIRVVSPSGKKKVDDIIIGYNGQDGTELTFEEGDNQKINITLEGRTVGMVSDDSCYSFDIYMSKTDKNTTNQEIVEKAIEQLKHDTYVNDMIPITKFIDVSPVNSKSTTALSAMGGQKFTWYELNVVDSGNSNALAMVAAQYQEKVERADRSGMTSTYTILAKDGNVPADYVQTLGSLLKGCENCPTGYTAEDGGKFFYLNVEDSTTDDSTAIQTAIANTYANAKVTFQGTDKGAAVYSVYVSDESADEGSVLSTLGSYTAQVQFVGTTKDLCTPDNPDTSISWSAGKSCYAVEEEYEIVLADNDCGSDRLADLQEFYPDLTISVDSTVTLPCQTKYKTTVLTDIQCEECDPAFIDLFTSEAPQPFGFTYWSKGDKVYDKDAKMGIRIRGKETLSVPSEYLRDDVPFFNTSVKISVTGGQPWATSYSYNTGVEGGFAVKVLERAADLENLGGNLWPLADRDETYFNVYSNDTTNSVNELQRQLSKAFRGAESVIDPNAQYVIYTVQVNPKTRTQGFNKVLNEGFDYMVAAPVGKHQDLEELLNGLAVSAGLPTVKA